MRLDTARSSLAARAEARAAHRFEWTWEAALAGYNRALDAAIDALRASAAGTRRIAGAG